MATSDDPFELWLGHMASERPASHRILGSANRAGRVVRNLAGAKKRFTGARIGRGAARARVLSTREHSASSARRVIVKSRIVKLAGKAAAAVAHLRYLERDGTTREGLRGSLYGRDNDTADGRAFLERGEGDRHQFRFIVAPEDGAEYEDLKSLTRRLMNQMEQDLGTSLDWVAVDHFNTGHPHTHIIVRGKDDRAQDLVIAPEYITRGMRERAIELVQRDLGPRTALEIEAMQRREVEQERLTGIDRRLIASASELGLVTAAHPDPGEQSLRAGRLQLLGALGLATEAKGGHWSLDPELEDKLRRLGERGDIIRTMQRAFREKEIAWQPENIHVLDPGAGDIAPITGRVIARGLSDEMSDRRYIVIDGIDGRAHYADLGRLDGSAPISEGSIVSLATRPIAIREVDRTVAAIAAGHDGHYSLDIHLQHDRQANDAFARSHVRRLEAIRRSGGNVVREADGRWQIAPDHLREAEAHERRQASRMPFVVETLSNRPLEQLPAHDGETWLDRRIADKDPEPQGDGFAREVRSALQQRRQWLVEQELAEADGGGVAFKAGALATLRRRELLRVAGQLARETGLGFEEATPGTRVEGRLERRIMVGDKPFALVERSREFSLVPWKPSLERAIGKEISGVVRGNDISWTMGGRKRGIEIG